MAEKKLDDAAFEGAMMEQRTRSMARGSRVLALAAVALVLAAVTVRSAGGQALAPGRAAPEIAGGPWINSEPLTMQALRGRVTLVEFWTYG